MTTSRNNPAAGARRLRRFIVRKLMGHGFLSDIRMLKRPEGRPPAAFTLIELLVVIAVISILASLIVVAGISAQVKAKINRARIEISSLETALDSYKAQRGTYPPDNPNDPALPQLFYELTGTLLNNGIFYRIHGGETLSQAALANPTYVFGPNVGGFVNSSPVSNLNDQSQRQQADARDFIPNLQPSGYYLYQTNGVMVALFGLPLDSPIEMNGFSPVGQIYTNQALLPAHFTPIRYVATNPTNNHDSYDLWVDVVLRGKTNRISNWNPEAEVVQ